MSTLQTHLDNLPTSVTVNSSASTGLLRDFSKIIVIDDLAASTQTGLTGTVSVGSNNSLMTEIGDTDDVAVAGIGTAARRVLTNIFAASRHPVSVHLLSVDLVGDDYTAIFADLDAVYSDYTAVVCVSNTWADIVATTIGATGASLAYKHLVFAELVDIAVAGAARATWESTNLASLTEAQYHWLWLSYHDKGATTAASHAEYAAQILSVDLDQSCPSANAVLRNQPAIANFASAAIKNNLDDNNISHGLPVGGASFYVDKGYMQDGLPIHTVLTEIWLQNRIQAAQADLLVGYAQRNTKLPLNSVGRNLACAAARGVIEAGIAAGHLLSKSEFGLLYANDVTKPRPYVTSPLPSSADQTSGTLRVNVLQYDLKGVRVIDTNFILSA